MVITLTGILFSCKHASEKIKKEERIEKFILKDDDDTEYEVIADTVKYLIPLDKDSVNDSPPFFVGFNKTKFISELVDSVLAGKVKAYNYFDNSVMTSEDIKQQMGETVDTVWIEDDNGEMEKEIVTNAFNPDDVRELYVYERWFYNPEKVRFRTEIIGFSPVRYVVKDDQPDGEVTKVILFTVFPDKGMKKKLLKNN